MVFMVEMNSNLLAIDIPPPFILYISSPFRCLSSCVCMQLSPPLLDPIALSLKSIGYYKSGNVKLEFDVEDVEGIIPHQNNPSSDVVHLLDRLGK